MKHSFFISCNANDSTQNTDSLMDRRYVCICNLIFDLQGKLCRDFAFSSVYLPVLNIICFLLAVLHPCFAYVFENFSCSFLKLFLARDILVCVLWLEVSQGYSTDVDSLYKSDSCLFIVVAESCYCWTCLTFITDTGFFCCPVVRPCRGSKVGMKFTFPFWRALSRNNYLTVGLWITSSSVTSVNAKSLHEITRKLEVLLLHWNAATPVSKS